MVGRRLEAALSASNHVKSQSSDLFIRKGKLDAREKKALWLCSDVLLESEGDGGRIVFSGYKRDIYAHRIFSLPVENWRRSWRMKRLQSIPYVCYYFLYYCVNIIFTTRELSTSDRLAVWHLLSSYWVAQRLLRRNMGVLGLGMWCGYWINTSIVMVVVRF